MNSHPDLPFDAVTTPAMAEASREAFAKILPTLTAREIEVFLGVCDYLRATGHEDVTGGELAEWMHTLTTSTRPRIHGLVKKGWLESGAVRASRARYEGSCHPVWPAVPRSAIERARVSTAGAVSTVTNDLQA